jgi:hypothetical protein
MKTKKKDTVPPRVPRQWRSHYQKLQSLRHSLLSAPCNDTIKILPAKLGMGGMSAGLEEHLAFGILLHEQDALFEVDAAMQRILDGTYGICEETGKAIPESRLRVVPWTRFTKEALEGLERARMSSRADLGPFASFQGASPS